MIILRRMKEFIPVKIRVSLKALYNYWVGYFKLQSRYKQIQDKHKVILLGTPIHDNLGDHAIAYAEYEFLQDKMPGCEIVEIPTYDFIQHFKALKKYSNKGDIFVLSGGGNMGDIYIEEEELRRDVILAFPKNKIIIFPQTIYFTDTKNGKKEFARTKKIYSKHNDLTIVAREKKSYEIMKEAFPNSKILLTPDIVLYCSLNLPRHKRKGALICLRSDKEGILNEERKQHIYSTLKENFNHIQEIDTCLKYYVHPQNRVAKLKSKWMEFMSHQIIITDRLHGMIFAAITGTPCIAISNYNHKVMSSYEWIKNLNYIKLMTEEDDLQSLIQQLKGLELNRCRNNILRKQYDVLSDVFKPR